MNRRSQLPTAIRTPSAARTSVALRGAESGQKLLPSNLRPKFQGGLRFRPMLAESFDQLFEVLFQQQGNPTNIKNRSCHTSTNSLNKINNIVPSTSLISRATFHKNLGGS